MRNPDRVSTAELLLLSCPQGCRRDLPRLCIGGEPAVYDHRTARQHRHPRWAHLQRAATASAAEWRRPRVLSPGRPTHQSRAHTHPAIGRHDRVLGLDSAPAPCCESFGAGRRHPSHRPVATYLSPEHGRRPQLDDGRRRSVGTNQPRGSAFLTQRSAAPSRAHGIGSVGA